MGRGRYTHTHGQKIMQWEECNVHWYKNSGVICTGGKITVVYLSNLTFDNAFTLCSNIGPSENLDFKSVLISIDVSYSLNL